MMSCVSQLLSSFVYCDNFNSPSIHNVCDIAYFVCFSLMGYVSIHQDVVLSCSIVLLAVALLCHALLGNAVWYKNFPFCSFKEDDIISAWDFQVDSIKAAAPPNRKTTKRQLINNVVQPQRRSSLPNGTSEQLIKRTSAMSSADTTSINESEFSTATEVVEMDLSSSKQVSEL